MSRYLVLMGLLFLAACTSTPNDIDNVCSVFENDDDWYQDARASEKRWGAPVPVMMAIMRRESGFQDDAKPARRWFLGFVPLGRPSSAYGYAQALDGTWKMYQKATDNSWADRDDFDDAIDFIGWYMNVSKQKLNFAANDAYSHALAYHEGWTGYANDSYKSKAAVRTYAQGVQTTAARYTRQLNGCRADLES
jgi:hypothetical protein